MARTTEQMLQVIRGVLPPDEIPGDGSAPLAEAHYAALAAQGARVEEAVENTFATRHIEDAEGIWLDLHARDRGMTRQYDETDEVLSNRVRIAVEGVSPEAISKAVSSVLDAGSACCGSMYCDTDHAEGYAAFGFRETYNGPFCDANGLGAGAEGSFFCDWAGPDPAAQPGDDLVSVGWFVRKDDWRRTLPLGIPSRMQDYGWPESNSGVEWPDREWSDIDRCFVLVLPFPCREVQTFCDWMDPPYPPGNTEPDGMYCDSSYPDQVVLDQALVNAVIQAVNPLVAAGVRWWLELVWWLPYEI